MKPFLKQNFPRWIIGLIIVSCAPHSFAQGADAPVVTVMLIDAIPQFAQPAAVLLTDLRRDSLHEPGIQTFELLQVIGHPNHFTLVEKWNNRKAYEAHNIAKATRHFRDEIQPMLAAPIDERIHAELLASP